jgi:hypothetical protein
MLDGRDGRSEAIGRIDRAANIVADCISDTASGECGVRCGDGRDAARTPCTPAMAAKCLVFQSACAALRLDGIIGNAVMRGPISTVDVSVTLVLMLQLAAAQPFRDRAGKKGVQQNESSDERAEETSQHFNVIRDSCAPQDTENINRVNLLQSSHVYRIATVRVRRLPAISADAACPRACPSCRAFLAESRLPRHCRHRRRSRPPAARSLRPDRRGCRD